MSVTRGYQTKTLCWTISLRNCCLRTFSVPLFVGHFLKGNMLIIASVLFLLPLMVNSDLVYKTQIMAAFNLVKNMIDVTNEGDVPFGRLLLNMVNKLEGNCLCQKEVSIEEVLLRNQSIGLRNKTEYPFIQSTNEIDTSIQRSSFFTVTYCAEQQASRLKFHLKFNNNCAGFIIQINCSFIWTNISAYVNQLNLPIIAELRINSCGKYGVNQIRYLSGRTLLKYLDLSNNNLTNISSNLLNDFLNLVDLDISSNKLMFLPRHIFYHQHRVEKLNLASNLLSTLPWDVFTNLSVLKELDLSNNKLLILPQNMFLNQNSLMFLDLSINKLSNLSNDVFESCTGLGILDISSNKLTSLSTDVFKHNKRLRMLFISSNNLTTLPADILKHNRMLGVLDISLNKLTSLPADILKHKRMLGILDISSNNLTTLPADILKHNRMLGILDISLNKLTSLPADILKHKILLNTLDISSNNLTSLPDDIFESNINLFQLGISSNMISSLPANIFKSNNLLQLLDISSNNVSCLPAEIFKHNQDLQVLDISLNVLSSQPADIFKHNRKLKMFDISSNILSYLPDDIFSNCNALTKLDMSSNMLLSPPGDFRTLFLLVYLNLSNNKIFSLSTDTFLGLRNLQILDLSYNRLQNIDSGTFNGLTNLSALMLNKNKLLITEGMFYGLENLETLLVDSYQICCVQPNSTKQRKGCTVFSNTHTALNCVDTYEPKLQIFSNFAASFHIKRTPKRRQNCFYPKDAISNCWNLIRVKVLRVFLWIIGTFALVGNTLVLLYRFTIDRHNVKSSHSLFVINLSISDLLMGVYMLIIATADSDFKGSYVYHEQKWKKSILCSSAGILCTISSEMSTFIVFMITIERFIVIVFPLSDRKITWKQAICISMVLWLLSTLLGIIPQISFESYFEGQFYSTSGVCIALPLTSDHAAGVEYSVSVFIVLNSIVFIAIFVASIWMYESIRSSRKNSSSQNRKREIAVARTLSYVVATDFCCWMPIGIIGTLAQLGGHISNDVYAWVIVFILPINSAINPFLYTASYIWRKKKRTKVKEKRKPKLGKVQKQPEYKETTV